MLILTEQLLLNSFISASYFVLLAISWSLIYSTTGNFHFAHAFIISAGAYAATLICTNLGLPLAVGILAAVIVGAVFGCLIEIFLYRTIARLGGSMMITFIASLGFVIVAENVMNIVFTPSPRTIAGFLHKTVSVGGVYFTTVHI